MSRKCYKRVFCRFAVLVILGCLFINCSNRKPPEQTVIVVKVPPFFNNRISQEENFWRFQHFLFPQQVIPNPVLEGGLPNDDSLLYVSVDESGNIKLNSEDERHISETKFLNERLTEIFHEREEAGVFEAGNWKVVKAVGIKTAHSIKYGDFMKVVDAVKQSGADPVVLLFDNDARPKFIEKISKKNK